MTAGSSSYSIFASRQARRASSRVSAITQKIGWPKNCTLPSASTGSSWRPVGEMSFSPGTSAGRQHIDHAGRGAHRRKVDRVDRRHARRSTARGSHAACRPAPACRRYRSPAPVTCLCAESWRWSVATPPAIFSALRLSGRVLVHRLPLTPPRTARPAAAPSCRVVSTKNRTQQVLRGQRPVFGRGAHVGERREIARHRRRAPPRPSPRVHGLPSSAASTALRPLRRRRHAAIGDADRRDRAVLGERQMEGAERRRDVLVAALGDLVDGEMRALGRHRHLRPPRRIRRAAGPACHRR